MAVYTHLTEQALRQHLRPFGLGELTHARGITAGCVNTVYEVHTTRGHFILRILEDHSALDARFEEALLVHLGRAGLAVPRMCEALRQRRVVALSKRQQLSVFEFLPGRQIGVFEVTEAHAQQIGSFLARLHLAARGLGRRRRNRFDPGRIALLAEACRKQATSPAVAQDLELLSEEIGRHNWARQLPRGIVHGDLFIDNVRFAGGRLCGVLDFEMACSGPLIYDLAVAFGDWAFEHDRFVAARAAALMHGYELLRPLLPAETGALYDFCRFTCARYALSRMHDFEFAPRPGAQRLYKDYRHFVRRLASLQALTAPTFREVLGRGRRGPQGRVPTLA